MALFLTILSGLAWTIVYAEGIRLGFRDRTYAIPVAALGLNFAWEWVYGINGLLGPITAQAVINLVWALADVVIVYTFFRFGRAEFPTLTKPMFVGWGLLIIAVSFAVQLLLLGEFGVNEAARYSAFLQNLLMSGLFIAMLVVRQGLRGQSLTIGVAKWIGTLAPTLLFGALHRSPLILGLGLMCSVLDLIYIWLILQHRTFLRTKPHVEAEPVDSAFVSPHKPQTTKGRGRPNHPYVVRRNSAHSG